MSNSTQHRLWITYAWADDDQGDFRYLVQELKAAGVDATYDKIAIVPGRRLWDQIAQQISQAPIGGWAYLITPNSLASERCREELAYALDRALKDKGGDFPLIGLLHGVGTNDVPPALRVRLCVSLASPDWKEEIRAGLEGRPPEIPSATQSQYVWQVHRGYGQNSKLTAVEARPRFGEIMYWRFIVPRSASVVRWGHGPAGGGAISGSKSDIIDGVSGTLDDTEVTWFGSGDKLSPGISAYVVFDETLPDFLGFALASAPFGQPMQPEIYRLR